MCLFRVIRMKRKYVPKNLISHVVQGGWSATPPRETWEAVPHVAQGRGEGPPPPRETWETSWGHRVLGTCDSMCNRHATQQPVCG